MIRKVRLAAAEVPLRSRFLTIRKVRLAAAKVPLQLRFLTIRKVRLAGYSLKFMLHCFSSGLNKGTEAGDHIK